MVETRVPTHDYMNIDPRQLEKFMRSPEFAQTITSEQYSGMSKRIATAKWTANERIVYDAVEEGYTDLDSLPVATGLPEVQVRSALASLVERGYIRRFGVDDAKTSP